MKVGHYEVTRKLGEGAMGEVFAAKDDRLGRSVALKLVHSKSSDTVARERLWREARAAAAVNHPNICQIYDVGEHEGQLYVAMELLEGEALSNRIARQPLTVGEAIALASGILDALAAIHRANVVHRDLKPSNVFLTPHGVKLLDFGLARGGETDPEKTAMQLTTPGTIVGTPRYMAPEQWLQSAVGPSADIFSCGAMLFEMLTGKPAFNGDSLPALCHAVAHDHPPALVGGPEIQALDRVITRALAKHPEDRYADAISMARDLRTIPQQQSGTLATQPRIRAVTRMIVLPFRLLRNDPEIDFLPGALADAVTSSLCGLESVVVRSSRAASGTQETDLRKLASEADVDLVLLGNLLRAGTQLRLTAQMIDGHDGRVIWSKTIQSSTLDIFELQDELTAKLLESLSLKLAPQDAPANARAYEMYLRAMNVGVHPGSSSKLMLARDLYREALRDDPGYAPAWARVGRIYRVISKYGHADRDENRRLAREAFQRAFELNSDLPLAHNLYTYFELEELGDSPGAIKRLLQRLHVQPSDPDLYAGLVTACRFAGLYTASAAADQRARRLDPQVQTSIAYTLWFQRDFARLAETPDPTYDFLQYLALYRTGERERAIAQMREIERRMDGGGEQQMIRCSIAALEGRFEDCLDESRTHTPSNDPEDMYFWSWQLAMVGEREMALDGLRRAVERNFCCHTALETESEFDFLRDDDRFKRIIAESHARHEHAIRVFREAGGEKLLG